MKANCRIMKLMYLLWGITTPLVIINHSYQDVLSNLPCYSYILALLDAKAFLFLLILPYLVLILSICRKFRYKHRLLACSLDQIDQLSGYDFEYYLYYLLRQKGLRAKVTPYTHDFGADLIIKHGRKKIVIQAKRWNETVGIKAVQETIGAVSYYRAKHGVVISNSFYSQSAISLADASGITLLNRHDLPLLIDADALYAMEFLLGVSDSNSTLSSVNETTCPFCGGRLVKRSGKFGHFYGCSNYPDCKYTQESLHP